MPVKVFLEEILVSDFIKESTIVFLGMESVIGVGKESSIIGKESFIIIVSWIAGFTTFFTVESLFGLIESFLVETESLLMVSCDGFLIVSTWALAAAVKIKSIKKRK